MKDRDRPKSRREHDKGQHAAGGPRRRTVIPDDVADVIVRWLTATEFLCRGGCGRVIPRSEIVLSLAHGPECIRCAGRRQDTDDRRRHGKLRGPALRAELLREARAWKAYGMRDVEAAARAWREGRRHA